MSFAEDLECGKRGERIARAVLAASARINHIIDCSNDEYFQNLDIDLLAERNDGRVLKIEVKTDRQAHRTGNIAWEKTTAGHIGCLEKSHADYILYYLSETNRLMIFEPRAVKNFIARNQPTLRRMGDFAMGYLLNIKELEAQGVIRWLN